MPVVVTDGWLVRDTTPFTLHKVKAASATAALRK